MSQNDKQLIAICYSTRTLSPRFVRTAAVYFDKLLVLEPIKDINTVEKEISEIDSQLRSMDKSYFTDIIRDNVPFWVTMGATSEPNVLIPCLITSFILSGISSWKHLTDSSYTAIENQRLELIERQKKRTDVEILAEHGIVESIEQQIKTHVCSIELTRISESLNLSQFELLTAAHQLYTQITNKPDLQVGPVDVMLSFKRHAALILEAYNRRATIVTDSPYTQRFLNIILSSLFTCHKEELPGNFRDYVSESLIKGFVGFNSVVSWLPDFYDSSSEDVLRLRDKNEDLLKRLRHYINDLCDQYHIGVKPIEQDRATQDICREIEIQLKELATKQKEALFKAATSSIEFALSWNLVKPLNILLDLYSEQRDRKKHGLRFLHNIKRKKKRDN